MQANEIVYIFEYPEDKVSYPYVSHMELNQLLDFGFKFITSGTIGVHSEKTELVHVIGANEATKQAYLDYLTNLQAESDKIKTERFASFRAKGLV